jgi:hypothetical protein
MESILRQFRNSSRMSILSIRDKRNPKDDDSDEKSSIIPEASDSFWRNNFSAPSCCVIFLTANASMFF